ncbi:hypothetical protein RUM43_001695 [Polyplax serrata]|uniref:5'-AMP-activated protein kinase subunit beta-1 n=1 Tax=Polyplax serrata TaxID=468196 RepID=A0AAN8SE96_POLSC
MGNAGSNTRERNVKGNETAPPSPTKEGQAFTFDKKKRRKGTLVGSHDDEGPVYTKQHQLPQQDDFEVVKRQRAATLSEGTKVSDRVLPTVFKWDGGGRQVYICGTFNDWKTNLPMVKSHGDFVTIIDLPEGEHEYKFYVDGVWKHDPKVKLKDSTSGTKHNLITVKGSDFEVFQALANDSENNSGDLQSEYSQEIPSNVSWEKVSGPPILPPHLLQVILNKDTPLSCEPTLLPEPNHVMLNHLYALSIKDDVMVLSATHRYRKKYVTTLLYKPI